MELVECALYVRSVQERLNALPPDLEISPALIQRLRVTSEATSLDALAVPTSSVTRRKPAGEIARIPLWVAAKLRHVLRGKML